MALTTTISSFIPCDRTIIMARQPEIISPPENSFSLLHALPADIIYLICAHLSDPELLQLQLISRHLRSKLPHHSISKIHAHKTYFLCQDGIKKLERIARIPRLASKVTHITFDLESPYVGLLKRYWCIGTAMSYPLETRVRMQRWYSNHMRSARKIRERSLHAKSLRRLLKRLFYSNTLSDEADDIDMNAQDDHDNGNYNKQEKEKDYQNAFHEIFTLFEVHLTSLYSRWQDKAEILSRITTAFRSLPNLSVIGFTRTDITKEPPSTMLKVWREYNPELAHLLKKNPEIEDGDLPWTDWFCREPLHSHLWEAYPSILFCAAQAKRRIKEVKVGNLSAEYPKAGAMISFFEPYHARISETTGGQASQTEIDNWVKGMLEGYKYTFSGLKRLELCLDDKEREGYHANYWEVSPLFTETANRVEELKVWRMKGDKKEGFLLPGGMKMEKLKRLEVGRAGVGIQGLLGFLRTNKDTLKEVICGEGTFGDETGREEIRDFLTTIRGDMGLLQKLEVDFVVGGEYRRLIDEKKYFLSVRIHGNWRDEGFCGFDVGLKYRFTTVAGEDTLRTHWVQKHSWEEFLKYIAEVDVVEHFMAR